LAGLGNRVVVEEHQYDATDCAIAIVIVSISLVLAVVFGAMQALGIALQRISLGTLSIALGLLVDDAMITIESMVFRLERGNTKAQAAVFAYASASSVAGAIATCDQRARREPHRLASPRWAGQGRGDE
jgi:AcrB/AcrD/AcrF family protein